jgi:hypothetical protein
LNGNKEGDYEVGTLVSNSSKSYIIDSEGNSILKDSGYTILDFSILNLTKNGFTKFTTLTCMESRSWDRSESWEDEDKVVFTEGKDYIVLERGNTDIIIIDDNCKKVKIPYYDEYYHKFKLTKLT